MIAVFLRLACTFLRACSLIIPARGRQRWVEEWRAELDVARKRSLRHAARLVRGSVRDALAVRRELGDQQRRMAIVAFRSIDQDVRQAFRTLRTAPKYSLSVIASLAIGIAATSAAFAFVHALTFKNVPGTEPERMVRVGVHRSCGWPGCWIDSSTTGEYDVLRNNLPSLQGLSARAAGTAAIRVGSAAHAVRAAAVSTNFFDVLGLTPSIGRRFTSDEATGPRADVAIIGESLWRRLFGSDPNVLGQFIEVAGRPVQIVGVMPRLEGLGKGNMEMGGPFGLELWVPLDLAPLFVRSATYGGGRPLPDDEYHVEYVGRLAAGRELVHAQADAAVATARLKAARADVYGTDGWIDVAGAQPHSPAEARRLFVNLMMVPLLVLAIACLNAANLLLARGSERAREIAVRLALGASGWRIVRQLLVESLLLALLAGIAAVPLARWLLDLGEIATGALIPLGARTMMFTLAASLACAVGFGLAPAVRAVGIGPSALGSSRGADAGPGRMRVRRTLVIIQVALSLGLLATGGQVLGAVNALYTRSGAREPERLVVASFDLAQLKIARPAGDTFYRDLLQRASQLPQVQNASLARRGALWTWGRGVGPSSLVAWRIGDAAKDGRVYLGGYVGGDLFGTIGLPIVQGRNFRAEDVTPRPTVAIVSRAFANTVLNGAAIGKFIKVGARNQPFAQSHEVRVVGVIEPAADLGYSKRSLPTVYLASPLEYEPALSLYLRLRSGSDTIVPALTAIVRELNPRVPITEVTTLAALFERRYFEERVMAEGLSLLGVVALSLAAAGLYAVVSFLVTARAKELGIRVALGASRSNVLRLVMRQAAGMAIAGGTIGLLAAVVFGAVVHANLVGAPRLDPLLFVASTLVLTVVIAAASYLPARRAARVDPLAALRQE